MKVAFPHVLVQGASYPTGIRSVLSIELHDRVGRCLLLLLVVATAAFQRGLVVLEPLNPSIREISPHHATDKGAGPKEIHPEISGSRGGTGVGVKVHSRALIQQLKNTISHIQERQPQTGTMRDVKKGFLRELTKEVVSESVPTRGEVGIVTKPGVRVVAEQMPQCRRTPGKADEGLDGEESRQYLNVQVHEKISRFAVIFGGRVTEVVSVRNKQKQNRKHHRETSQ